MNLTNFLKQTDTLTADYSAAQLTAFIHEIGRVLPERYREDFLRRLKAAGKEAEKPSDKAEVNEHEFNELYKHVRENLKIIDSQEIAIEKNINEEYDDWYDDYEEEFYYEDNEGISEMLEEACDFVHACMDMERYKEGFAIGTQLFSMEILYEGDFGEDEISLKDMVDYELLQYDLNQIVLDATYCAYHAVPLQKRPGELYRMLVNAGRDGNILEAMMQHGDEELSDFQEFLSLWIRYLSDQTGRNAEQLFLEAVGLLNDVSF